MMTEGTAVLDSRYSWLRLGVCLMIGSIAGVGMWSVVLVMPAVEAEFGADRGTVSLAYTATMLGYAFGNFFLGRMIDRFGAALVIGASGAVLAAGFAAAALAPGLQVLMAAQGVLIGIGSAGAFAPLIADISHWFMRWRGIAVAVCASGNYVAGAVWPLALKGPIETFGWRPSYLAVAVIVGVTMIPLSLLLRRRPPEGVMGATIRRGASAPHQTALSPGALTALLSVAGIGCCMAMAMPQVHIVALCADLGYGVSAGADMLALMLGAGIASRLASGFLADRIGGVATLLIGSIGQGLALILYVPAEGLASLYVVSLIFGLAQGGIVPSYAVIVREYLPPREAGTRSGFVIMMTVLGMAMGGWLSGAIYDWTGSYTLAFVNGVGWNVVNLAAILAVIWFGRGRSPATA